MRGHCKALCRTMLCAFLKLYNLGVNIVKLLKNVKKKKTLDTVHVEAVLHVGAHSV